MAVVNNKKLVLLKLFFKEGKTFSASVLFIRCVRVRHALSQIFVRHRKLSFSNNKKEGNQTEDVIALGFDKNKGKNEEKDFYINLSIPSTEY